MVTLRHRRYQQPHRTSDKRIGIGCATYLKQYKTYQDFLGTYQNSFRMCRLRVEMRRDDFFFNKN